MSVESNKDAALSDRAGEGSIAPFDAPAVPRRGYAYVAIAAILWAASGTSAKFLFQSGVSTYQVLQARVSLGVVILFLWLWWKSRSSLTISARDIPYFAVLGVVGLAMVQFTYLYTISKIQVAAAILMEYLSPICVALYVIAVERERPGLRRIAAIAGAACGCYLVVGGYNLSLLALNREGIIGGICSAVAFAFYSLYGEKGMRRYDPWTVLFFALFFATVFWNSVHTPFEFARRSYTFTEFLLLAYIIVFGTVAFSLYFKGISLIRSTRASIVATLEPITAAAISYFFLGESLEPLQLAGAALVIFSVVLLQIKKEYDAETPDLIRSRCKAPSGTL
ncbi:MAG: DMT family transporter [Syntrophobacteraceae bacterium]